jgi:DMSO/TMAO reductase YedYZ molybdopterin-dependent catalytic subunit
MRQPDTGARETGGGWPGASATSAPDPGAPTTPPGSAPARPGEPGAPHPGACGPSCPPGGCPPGPGDQLPPGQYIPRKLPVLHYGPIPAFRQQTWDLRISGATESGAEHVWNWAEVSALPRAEVVADLHCVTRFTIPGNHWGGIPAAEVLRAAPPAGSVTHVMVWADYGYSANLRIADFAAETTLLATHLGGAPLTPEHGFPLRLVVPSLYAWKSVKWVRAIEYLTRDRRGFWEERGYHNTADPWREQRYSYQEEDGEGPPL